MPRLSVVVPTLGRSPYLDETLESVRKITCISECIIVGPKCVAERIPILDSRFKFVPEPVGLSGLYPALNYAYRNINPGTEFFTYINDDDYLLDGFNRSCALLNESDESVGFCFGKVKVVDSLGGYCFDHPICRDVKDVLLLLRWKIVGILQPGTLYRNQFITELNGFSEEYKMASDFELLLRGLTRSWKGIYNDNHCAAFRVHSKQLSSNSKLSENELNRIVQLYGNPSSRRNYWALMKFRRQNIFHSIRRIILTRRVFFKNSFNQ
jgi:glycosyltransferase involved in cell wall biosynthesis